MTLAPGTTVGRYQILEPLGQGGMATVYKAFQPSLEREVALKVLRPGYSQDPEFRERFEREAKAIARLRHPHIVQVFDFEVAQSGEYVLAMEFLEGGTLKERVAGLAVAGRGLDPAESVRILGEVAEALGYAHDKGIVHRDVKPANVMLTHKDRAVVTDFGIARILGATSHTQTGVGIGTPEYMAPEQGQGGAIDHKADIYGLGAMAYELLVGRVPYTADTPLAVVIAHIKDPLPLPRTVNSTIGPGVERALLRALAKDPAQRYDSAVAFAEALKAGLAEDTRGGTLPTVVVRGVASAAGATPPRIPERPTFPALARRQMIVGVSAALVLAVVAGTVVASNALRAPSGGVASSTVAPTATTSAASGAPAASGRSGPAKVPARGALIWQAKLDGTDVDIRGTPTLFTVGDQSGSEVRFVPGAIEFVMNKAPGGRNISLNSPTRDLFVLEVDVDPRTGGSFGIGWWAQNPQYLLNFDIRQGRLEFQYYKSPQPEPLTQSVPADDVRKGNPFTATLVVERSMFTGYVGGRQIIQAAPDGRIPPAAAAIRMFFGGDPGTLRVTGIRMYELPPAAQTSGAPASSAPIALPADAAQVRKGQPIYEASSASRAASDRAPGYVTN